MRKPPFASIWFDCDSTLSAIEGIDELVRPLPAAAQQELLLLTERAMNGELPLAEVYERRLAAIAPTRAQVDAVGALYVERVVADAKAVVEALRFLGKQVGVVSGGLLPPVLALARHLGIDDACVFAVPLQFAADGRYADFDRASPLWRNGGKIDVLNALPTASRPLAFVGDGATDLETQGKAADLFVGFGGVVARPAVRRGAETFVDGPGLAGVLPHVLTSHELASLAAHPTRAGLLAGTGLPRT